jgi:hypothetical protein
VVYCICGSLLECVPLIDGYKALSKNINVILVRILRLLVIFNLYSFQHQAVKVASDRYIRQIRPPSDPCTIAGEER